MRGYSVAEDQLVFQRKPAIREKDLKTLEKAVLKHYYEKLPVVQNDILDEMVRYKIFCPHKLEMYAPASKSLVFRKTVIDQLTFGYMFILGKVSNQDCRNVTIYHQSFYLLRILQPDEPSQLYKDNVKECGKCFGVREIVNSRWGHQCGHFLKVGPFWWVRGSKRLCCPGCFRNFSTAELGDFVSHILCDHASWGEPVEKFLLCSRDEIVHHLNQWYKKETKDGIHNHSAESYAKMVQKGQFCYRINIGRLEPRLRQDIVKEHVDTHVPHNVHDDFGKAVRGVQGFVNPDHV